MDKKFIESLASNGLSILTDTGFEPIEASHKTIPYKIWILVTDSFQLECADNHIVFLQDGYKETFVKDLKAGDLIHTENGVEKVIGVTETSDEVNMYDLQVGCYTHRYYTNGILSHNTTVTLDILANAQKNGSKVLFISAEMNQVDLYLYVQRYPKFGNLDIFFPQEIEDGEDPRKVLHEILDEGYDLVLIDSFIELQMTIREHAHMTSNGSEKWLLDLMYGHNLGGNKAGTFTSFLNIQQVNKGGTFVGSNKLKHMTTGMMEIRFVDERTQDERYVVFSKNRRGHVGKQMFFDLSSSGDVVYDTERFKKSESLKELKKKEKELIKTQGLDFDKLFGLEKEKESEE
jgi:RecA/RadA recombinase